MLSCMELIQIMSFNAVINITESILGFAEDYIFWEKKHGTVFSTVNEVWLPCMYSSVVVQ